MVEPQPSKLMMPVRSWSAALLVLAGDPWCDDPAALERSGSVPRISRGPLRTTSVRADSARPDKAAAIAASLSAVACWYPKAATGLVCPARAVSSRVVAPCVATQMSPVPRRSWKWTSGRPWESRRGHDVWRDAHRAATGDDFTSRKPPRVPLSLFHGGSSRVTWSVPPRKFGTVVRPASAGVLVAMVIAVEARAAP